MRLSAILRRVRLLSTRLFGKQKRLGFWMVLGAGAVITAIITFPNHYTFRTYGYDLGYIAQIVHLISRGEIHFYVSSGDFFGTYTEPHYTLFHLWCAPLYLVFGTWGLLLAQWLGIIIGAIGVYKYARLHLPREGLAALSMAQFFGMWGVLGLLAFDVHEFTTVALPWIFYFLEQRKTALTLLSWMFFITTKENITLWSLWMLPGLFLLYREKAHRKILLLLGSLSLVWLGLSWGISLDTHPMHLPISSVAQKGCMGTGCLLPIL